jgi:hypothetical protein
MGKLDAAYRRNGQGASRLSHPVARSRAIGDDGEERERMDSSNGPGRTLHLVDIENLVGAPTTWTDQRVRTVFEQFLQGASWTPDDSLVVASNPNLMGRLMFWLSASGIPHRALCGNGTDRADQLLLEAVPNDVSGCFGRVVVGSGDHAFAPLVSRLKGTTTTLVVLGAGKPNWRLYRAASDVCQLPRTRSGQAARACLAQGVRSRGSESVRRLGMDSKSLHRDSVGATRKAGLRGSHGGNEFLEADHRPAQVGGSA